MKPNNNESLLQFPCDFVIKVFGHATPDFEENVLSIIRFNIKDLEENSVKKRPSKDGKYLSLSITLPIDSREQLDNIYKALSDNQHVIMVL